MAASSHAPDGIAYQCMYKILYNLTNLGYQLCNYKYFEFGNTSCHKTRLPCKKTNNMLQNYSMGEVASSSLLVGTHSRISICTYIYIYILYHIIFSCVFILAHQRGVPKIEGAIIEIDLCSLRFKAYREVTLHCRFEHRVSIQWFKHTTVPQFIPTFSGTSHCSHTNKQVQYLPACRHYTQILPYPLYTTTIPRRTLPCHPGGWI